MNDKFSGRPEYIGIKWFKEQRMPEPLRELTPAEFRWHFHGLDRVIQGVGHDQLFLDWGAGPLAKNPQVSWTCAGAIYYDPSGSVCRFKDNVRGVFVEGIVTDMSKTLITLQSEGAEFLLNRDDVEIKTEYSGYGGWNDSNLWSVRFFWYYDSALAFAQTYMRKDSYESSLEMQEEQNYQSIYFVPGLGEFVRNPADVDDKYGYAVRYFRIGCEHKDKVHTNPKMFEHKVWCPDCGWNAVYDSSD